MHLHQLQQMQQQMNILFAQINPQGIASPAAPAFTPPAASALPPPPATSSGGGGAAGLSDGPDSILFGQILPPQLPVFQQPSTLDWIAQTANKSPPDPLAGPSPGSGDT